jgi:hypothetical protein
MAKFLHSVSAAATCLIFNQQRYCRRETISLSSLCDVRKEGFPADSVVSNAGQFGGGTLATLFLAGTAGIVLGILALLGIQPLELSAIAVIAFGAALVLSSNAVWQLHVLRRSAMGAVTSGSEILASEMASGSAGVQALAGLAAIVLGILAVVGTNPIVLTPVALAVMGVTIVMTGSTLSGAVASFMGSTTITTSLKSPTA